MTREIPTRRTGSLSLYLVDSASPEGGNLYAHLRLCRGFLDDLNRIVPIRLRIRIESGIAQGQVSGRMDGSGAGPDHAFRWEFTED